MVQPVPPAYDGVGQETRKMIDISRNNPNRVYCQVRQGYSDIYLCNGKRWLFYRDKLKDIDGELVSGEPLTNLWDDLRSNNLHNEGGVKFPKGHTCPKSVSVLDSIWFTSAKQRFDQGSVSFKKCLFHGLNETGTARLWPLDESLCSWTALRRRWQPGFHYPGQTRPKSPIEAIFRTLSLRIRRFLDSSAEG